MNPDTAIARARLLLEQDRYDQAAELLRGALAQIPNNSEAHGMLALCLMQDRDHLLEATREAEQAIHLEPDDPFGYYIRAIVLDARNQTKEATETIQQAIQLDPTQVHLHGMHATLLMQDGNKWQQALEAAEMGLAYDPEDEQCAAIRSIALERTGRVDDAIEEAKRAVKNSPDSSYAHSTLGWALLHQGDHRKSQEAFREALRLEPSNEFARNGMMQALNSSNPIYRMFHGLMIRISRLDSKVQMGLFIGLWLGVNALNRLADRLEWLAPWVLPIQLFYLLFVMMAWIIQPIFNTLLRFNRFGRHLLTKKETWASNLIAGSLLFGVTLGTTIALLGGEMILFVLPALHAVFLTIPISVAFNTSAEWAKWTSIFVAIGFAFLYLINMALLFTGNVFLTPMLLFTYGILIYCFASAFLTAAEEKV